ncbi:MAG: FecR domain-containing protein [Deltaproteobacteria bacterium]|nr:FecR domain-containing protein [Deltaproteobacteria bacterium]
MSDDPLLRAAAEVLRDAATERVPPPSEHDRLRAVVMMEAARDQAQRRTTLRRAVWPLAAAAAALLVAGIAAKWPRKPAPALVAAPVARTLEGRSVVVRAGVELPVAEGVSVEAGDRIVNDPGARAGLALPTGTHLLVEGSTDVAVTGTAATQSFFLASGAVRADVAKLREGERFLVRTADGEIEVRGTSFRVARVASDPTCQPASSTRVEVFEGLVVVRANGVEARVAAGERWPRCSAPAPVTPAAPAVASVAVPSSAPVSPPKSLAGASSPKPTEVSASDLAEQNDMFAAAIAHKRAGNAHSAIVGFERLLARFPGCALAEQATVERFKLLAVTDRSRAVDAARAYLHRYPGGYARRDAEAIVAGTP